MKTLNRKGLPGTSVIIATSLLSLLTLGRCGMLSTLAQDASTGAAPTPAAQSTATNQPSSLSSGVSEIVKMADAGVSADVIKVYVECSTTAYQLTDVDVVTLKKHNVPDEVVTLLLKRGAQARTAVAQARNEAVAHALSSRNMASGGLDPNSYDYFQYYYLQPRALASAYARLYPYYGYYPSFGYHYGPYSYPYSLPPGPPFAARPLPH